LLLLLLLLLLCCCDRTLMRFWRNSEPSSAWGGKQ
jgi:hypothetical protein